MKRKVLLVLHLVSLGLLVPGLFLNILKIDITANFFVEINLFSESRSVLGTLRSLWESRAWLAFLLILAFGILIPAIKSFLIFRLLASRRALPSTYKLVAATGKWAMADVFAISILVAFLGANAMKATHAVLEPGFYYFSAYVLLSAWVVSFLPKMGYERPEIEV